jgi:hypothetical protein
MTRTARLPSRAAKGAGAAAQLAPAPAAASPGSRAAADAYRPLAPPPLPPPPGPQRAPAAPGQPPARPSSRAAPNAAAARGCGAMMAPGADRGVRGGREEREGGQLFGARQCPVGKRVARVEGAREREERGSRSQAGCGGWVGGAFPGRHWLIVLQGCRAGVGRHAFSETAVGAIPGPPRRPMPICRIQKLYSTLHAIEAPDSRRRRLPPPAPARLAGRPGPRHARAGPWHGARDARWATGGVRGRTARGASRRGRPVCWRGAPHHRPPRPRRHLHPPPCPQPTPSPRRAARWSAPTARRRRRPARRGRPRPSTPPTATAGGTSGAGVGGRQAGAGAGAGTGLGWVGRGAPLQQGGGVLTARPKAAPEGAPAAAPPPAGPTHLECAIIAASTWRPATRGERGGMRCWWRGSRSARGVPQPGPDDERAAARGIGRGRRSPCPAQRAAPAHPTPLRFLQQAEALVTAVHATLGFTRDGAARLPGASERHPTRGGLRIGKPHADGGRGGLVGGCRPARWHRPTPETPS